MVVHTPAADAARAGGRRAKRRRGGRRDGADARGERHILGLGSLHGISGSPRRPPPTPGRGAHRRPRRCAARRHHRAVGGGPCRGRSRVPGSPDRGAGLGARGRGRAILLQGALPQGRCAGVGHGDPPRPPVGGRAGPAGESRGPPRDPPRDGADGPGHRPGSEWTAHRWRRRRGRAARRRGPVLVPAHERRRRRDAADREHPVGGHHRRAGCRPPRQVRSPRVDPPGLGTLRAQEPTHGCPTSSPAGSARTRSWCSNPRCASRGASRIRRASPSPRARWSTGCARRRLG